MSRSAGPVAPFVTFCRRRSPNAAISDFLAARASRDGVSPHDRKHGATLVATVVAMGGSAMASPIATADQASWNGWQADVPHGPGSRGTSMAASQRDAPHRLISVQHGLLNGQCVASVVDGPTPKNNVASTTRFDWIGPSGHDQRLALGPPASQTAIITFDPANSVTSYSPQSGWSPAGTFQTTISEGPAKAPCHSGHGPFRRSGSRTADRRRVRGPGGFTVAGIWRWRLPPWGWLATLIACILAAATDTVEDITAAWKSAGETALGATTTVRAPTVTRWWPPGGHRPSGNRRDHHRHLLG